MAVADPGSWAIYVGKQFRQATDILAACNVYDVLTESAQLTLDVVRGPLANWLPALGHVLLLSVLQNLLDVLIQFGSQNS
jgi:hypothetical protein